MYRQCYTGMLALFVSQKASIRNLCLSPSTGTTGTFYEYELLQDMFANYSPIIRPVINATDAIQVRLGAALQQIIEMVTGNLRHPFFFLPRPSTCAHGVTSFCAISDVYRGTGGVIPAEYESVHKQKWTHTRYNYT